MIATSVPFPVDLSLFEGTCHSPSLPSLQRSLGREDLQLQDFCIPVNPYFPTHEIFEDFKLHLESILKYYPSSNRSIASCLAGAFGLDPATVVMGNGSTELITWIDLLLIGNRVATPVPTFGLWTDHPAAIGKDVCAWHLHPASDFHLDVAEFAEFVRRAEADTVVLCNPNNPTGACLNQGPMTCLLDALADLKLIVIDESFIDFAEEEFIPSVVDEATRRENVIVLKSLGKNCGLHGIRAGYAVANPRLAQRLRTALPPWNVNAMTEALIRALSSHQAEYEFARRLAVADRRRMEQRLRSLPGVTVFPSRANFVYVQVPAAIDGVALRNWLLCEYGYLVRECGNKLGSDSSYFRLAARPAEQVEALVEALRTAMLQLAAV
jgi:histidinol-phosphate/aromatic aminotransferase/cobyric acid decarboxylase-like protein